MDSNSRNIQSDTHPSCSIYYAEKSAGLPAQIQKPSSLLRSQMTAEVRVNIDARAILVAGVTAGAAYALYRVALARPLWTQHGSQTPANGSRRTDDEWQRAQQLQLHYASSLLPAPAPDSRQPACALQEVGIRVTHIAERNSPLRRGECVKGRYRRAGFATRALSQASVHRDAVSATIASMVPPYNQGFIWYHQGFDSSLSAGPPTSAAALGA